MARYGADIDRQRMGLHDFAEQQGQGGGAGPGGRGDQHSGYGRYGDGSATQGMIGGMRSDAGGTRWDRFPGEEGWYGQGHAGYPGGGARGGARAYGGEFRGAGRGSGRQGGFGEGGFGSGRSEGFGGGYRGGSGWGGGTASYQPRQRSGGGQSDADRIRAREIMTDNPECVTPDTTIIDVAKKMRDLDVGIIPVVDSQESRRLRGVITDRDLAVRVLAEGKDGQAKVSDYMTGQVETVNQNDTVRRVLEVMKREQVRRVPVTDRDGRLVGVIAQADLAVSYAGLDLQRETEVEEAIERISEPARPRGR